MVPGYPIQLASSTAAASAFTATAAGSILGSGGVGAIPAGMLQVGSMIRVSIRGIITTATTPGTITFTLNIGSAVASQSLTSPTLVASQTNQTFALVIEAVVRTVGTGTAATLVATATFQAGACLTTGIPVMLPASGAPTAGTGFDTTVANKVDVQGTFSLTTNSLTVQSSLIELFQ